MSSNPSLSPSTIERLKTEAEAAIQADLLAPLCQTCEGSDAYERSPEQCAACAANRVKAVLATISSPVRPEEATEWIALPDVLGSDRCDPDNGAYSRGVAIDVGREYAAAFRDMENRALEEANTNVADRCIGIAYAFEELARQLEQLPRVEDSRSRLVEALEEKTALVRALTDSQDAVACALRGENPVPRAFPDRDGSEWPLAQKVAELKASLAQHAQELEQARAQLAKREAEIKGIIRVARKYGWNGVENSKILTVFLDSGLDELNRERDSIHGKCLVIVRSERAESHCYQDAEDETDEFRSGATYGHETACDNILAALEEKCVSSPTPQETAS